jgi:PAS domain S-box-containing protein
MSEEPTHEGSEKRIQEFKQKDFEHKLSMEALRDSEIRYNVIFNNAHHAIALADPKGNLINFNTKAAQMLGYTLEEFSGKNVLEITYHEDVKSSRENIKMLLEGKINSYRSEKRYICKDSSVLWADLSVRPIYNFKGYYKLFKCSF